MKDSTEVEPIVNIDDIEKIRSILSENPRDLLLFDLITQTGGTVDKLLQLRCENLLNCRTGDQIDLSSERDGNVKKVTINRRVLETFNRYAESKKISPEDYLFASRKGLGPLTLPSASRLVKGWFKKVGLKNTGGILSLKKTWEVHFSDTNHQEPLTQHEANHTFKTLIPPPTIQETVLLEIENSILCGRMKPGSKIVADEVAKQMGTSRMPVREALSRLEARGFLRSQRGKFEIVQLSRDNFEEIIEVRILLETAAAKIAVPITSEETVRKLKSVHAQYQDAVFSNEVDKTLRLNRNFHRIVYLEGNQQYLLQLIEDGWNRVSPYYHMLLRKIEYQDQIQDVNFHQQMLGCVCKGNADGFCHWLEKDIREAARLVLAQFEAYKLK